MHRKPKNLRGHVSGRLVATYLVGKRNGSYEWRCVCRCGKIVNVRSSILARLLQKSCGCLVVEKGRQRFLKHGFGRTPLAAVWRSMIARCHNPKSTAYWYYGKRGITVCKRWRNSFTDFMSDMQGYSVGLQIDRLDNEGGYWCGGCEDCQSRGVIKSNCAWRTAKENARNTRRNVFLTHDGKKATIGEWAETTGIDYGTLWKRHEDGWDDSRVVTTPVRRAKHRHQSTR